ncbi:MAG TPA: MFS transporter, partial [Candidatus Caenarcaniphilales bacterium]|nr:MFS transporter [Candidatus Caenarcaniphilales bacterium]
LSGVGFGVYLLAHAAGGLLAGRLMDSWGRRNALMLAFLVGAIGAATVYLSVDAASLPGFMSGLVVLGLGTGGANLARAAGADMYPPAKRAWGITLVLVGAAFGAIGAPLLFAPLLAGARSEDPGALAAPWPLAAATMAVGALVLLAIRVDPREIAVRLATPAAGGVTAVTAEPPAPTRSLGQLFALPMVPLALLAAVISQAVMTATMALAGLVLVGHGHDLASVSITLSAHFLGMFGLVLVVGKLVDRMGRFRSVIVGLVVLAAGVLALLPGGELVNFVPGMFAIGVGWNIAFVASTAVLADAARPAERGRLLGFSDALSVAVAAGLSFGAGWIVGSVGLAVLVVVGVLVTLVPAALIALNRTRLEGAATTAPHAS